MDEAELRWRHHLSLLISFLCILPYVANEDSIFEHGGGEFTSLLVHIWLNSVGQALLLPCFLLCDGARELLEAEYYARGNSARELLRDVLIAASWQAGVAYLWSRAQLSLPEKHLRTIFNSIIGIVYYLEVVFLERKISLKKVAGVMLALVGVCVASASRREGEEGDEQLQEEMTRIRQALSVLCAIASEVLWAAYLVWYKLTFGWPSLRFVALFNGLVASAHLCPMLPLLVLGHQAGAYDAQLRFDASKWRAGLSEAATAAFVGLGYHAAVALRGPLLWASFQVLILPLGALAQRRWPKPAGMVGHSLIVAAFLMVTRFGKHWGRRCFSCCQPPAGGSAADAARQDAPVSSAASQQAFRSTFGAGFARTTAVPVVTSLELQASMASLPGRRTRATSADNRSLSVVTV